MKYARIGLTSALVGVFSASGAVAQSKFVRDWSGFYGGLAIGNFDAEVTGQSFSNTTGLPLGAAATGKIHSPIYHARLSYNWMLNPALMFGIQGGVSMLDTATSSTSGGVTTSLDNTWVGAFRARGGIVSHNTIFYGTAGGILRNQQVLRVAAGAVDDTASKGYGWTAGFGIEHAIDQRWSVFLEARRNWIDSKVNFPNAGFRSENSSTSDVVFFGVNFKIR